MIPYDTCKVYLYTFIGGNLVRLSKESGMQKTRLPSAIPDTILLSVKNTGLRKQIRVRVRVIFIICLKLIIVDKKYH